MNTPAIAAATPSQITTAPVSATKSDKPQRRMARPPLEVGSSTAGATAASAPPVNKTAPSPVPGSKTAAVIALLERQEGATLAELVAATGWLSHTTRAALTGLRKKNHAIERFKRGDETCYRIVVGAADTEKPAA